MPACLPPCLKLTPGALRAANECLYPALSLGYGKHETEHPTPSLDYGNNATDCPALSLDYGKHETDCPAFSLGYGNNETDYPVLSLHCAMHETDCPALLSLDYGKQETSQPVPELTSKEGLFRTSSAPSELTPAADAAPQLANSGLEWSGSIEGATLLRMSQDFDPVSMLTDRSTLVEHGNCSFHGVYHKHLASNHKCSTHFPVLVLYKQMWPMTAPFDLAHFLYMSESSMGRQERRAYSENGLLATCSKTAANWTSTWGGSAFHPGSSTAAPRSPR